MPHPGKSALLEAALVHVFTASGIVCALLATLATLAGAWERAFAWLGLAFLIDGIDGTLARWARVADELPRFSGDKLDNVIDYVTYVFVPVLMLLQAGRLTGATGIAAAAMALMTSLFHFCDLQSKTEDGYFVGFPAIWNLVAFYLFAFPLPPVLVVMITVVCSALTFVPMRWLHPLRVRRLRTLNVFVTAVWAAAATWTVLVSGFPATPLAQLALAVTGLYGVAVTLLLPWGFRQRDRMP